MATEKILDLNDELQLMKNRAGCFRHRSKAKVLRLLNIIDEFQKNVLFYTYDESLEYFKRINSLYTEITNKDDVKKVIDLIVERKDIPDIIRKVTNNYTKWEPLVPLFAGVTDTNDDLYLTDSSHRYLKTLDSKDELDLIESIVIIIKKEFSLGERLNSKIKRAELKVESDKEKAKNKSKKKYKDNDLSYE